MKVIVAGAGTLGRRVTRYVSTHHTVTIIEQDPERCQAVTEEFRGWEEVSVILGDIDEPSVLLQAGVDRADVFVAATANRINLLPAEIIRKGRFDQVFFVELPNEEERKEILGIHLRAQALDPGKYDLVLLASAGRGWNGAEIEQAVVSARIACNAEGRPVEERDLLTAMGQIVPLSTTMSEQIKAIRSWARTRALPATTPGRPEM